MVCDNWNRTRRNCKEFEKVVRHAAEQTETITSLRQEIASLKEKLDGAEIRKAFDIGWIGGMDSIGADGATDENKPSMEDVWRTHVEPWIGSGTPAPQAERAQTPHRSEAPKKSFSEP